MPLPITVENDDKVKISQRVWVDRNGGQFVFSPRTARVRKVEFNAGNGVLCRVKGK